VRIPLGFGFKFVIEKGSLPGWIALSLEREIYPKRYEARECGPPLIGVKAGCVYDLYPDEPRAFEYPEHGFKYVTTLSNAKRIARKANRLDRKAS
jgi:hypothetical protein